MASVFLACGFKFKVSGIGFGMRGALVWLRMHHKGRSMFSHFINFSFYFPLI